MVNTQLKILRVFGPTAAEVSAVLRQARADGCPGLRLLERDGEFAVCVQVSAPNRAMAEQYCDRWVQKLRAKFGDDVFAEGETSLAQATLDLLLKKRKLLVAVDETTGRLLGGMLQPLPHSEAVFDFGTESYADPQRRQQIQVPAQLLKKFPGDVVQAAAGRAVTALQATGADCAAAYMPATVGQGPFVLICDRNGAVACALPPERSDAAIANQILDLLRRRLQGLRLTDACITFRPGKERPLLLVSEAGQPRGNTVRFSLRRRTPTTKEPDHTADFEPMMDFDTAEPAPQPPAQGRQLHTRAAAPQPLAAPAKPVGTIQFETDLTRAAPPADPLQIETAGPQAAAVHPVPLVQQALVVAVCGCLRIGAAVEHGQPAAQVAFDAALEDGFGHAVQEKVHIGKRHRARGQHLRDGDQRAVIRGFVAQLVLKREHLFVQPALQRQVFRIAAQQRHGRVAVHVVKAGQQQAVAAVIGLAEVLRRGGTADIGDAAVPHADVLPAFQGKIFIQQIDLGKQHMVTPLQWLVCFCAAAPGGAGSAAKAPPPLQRDIVRDDVRIPAVRQAEPARDDAQLHKAQLAVQRERGLVVRHHSVELQNAKAERFGLGHAVPHERLADVPPAQGARDRVARVADMPAAADVVRVQDIEPDDRASLRVARKAGERLGGEKRVSALRVQQLGLREGHAVRDDLVPHCGGRCRVLLLIGPNDRLHRYPLLC